MRTSLCLATSAIGATAWTLFILIYGSQDMAHYGRITGNATSFLDDANTKYNAAKNALQATQDRIAVAQQSIVDANCFINQYPAFSARFNTYCAPAMKAGNNVDILNAFGLEIVRVADTMTPSTVYDKYRFCYPGTEPDLTSINCKKDTAGNLHCPPVTICDTHQYSYPSTLYAFHGTLIQGSGSEAKMNCGKYSQAITVNRPIKSTTDTGLQSVTVYYPPHDVNLIQSQTRTTRDFSKVDINSNVDSAAVTTPMSINVDPNIVTLSVAAAPVVQALTSQCTALNRTLSSPARYQGIVDTNTAAITSLQADAVEQQKAVAVAAEYQKKKQATFDSVNADYQQALSVWLPQLFVGVPALIIICCLIDSCLRDRDPGLDHTAHVDTEEPYCGVPNPCPNLPSFDRYKTSRAMSDNSAPNATYDAENPPTTAFELLNRPAARTVAQTTSNVEYTHNNRFGSAHSAPSYEAGAAEFNPQATFVSEGSATNFAEVYQDPNVPVAQVVMVEAKRYDGSKLALN